jgi:hypothetical protein
MDGGACDAHNGNAAKIGSDKGRGDRLRDLVLAELLSTYTRSLGNALSMLDREHQTESAETWTRAGVRRQQIGVVESKSLDDSTSWAIGQARLPDTSRGPAVPEENVPEGNHRG